MDKITKSGSQVRKGVGFNVVLKWVSLACGRAGLLHRGP